MSGLSANSLPLRNTRETAVVVFFWINLVIMSCVALTCFIFAFSQMWRQQRIMTVYQQVQAKVLSSRVNESQDSHGVARYDAAIRYQYSVNGQTYQSDEVNPIYDSGSQELADSLVAKYKTGQTCDAYYDPANPTQAVLLHRYYFSPYTELLQAAFIWTGCCFSVLYLWFAKKPRLMAAANGWYAIVPALGQRDRLFIARTCVIVGYIIAAIPTVHYFLYVPSPHNHVGTFEFAYALGLVPILFWFHYWRMNRSMDEAQVLVDQPEGILGRQLRFSVTQVMRRESELKSASLRLRCQGFKNKSNSLLFETRLAGVKDQQFQPGQELTLSGETTLPANMQPTGRDATGKFDRIGWKLLLDCKLRGVPDYSMEYRFDVKAPLADNETPAPAVRSSAMAEIRAIDPQFAGRIMSKRNFALGQLLTIIPLLIQIPSLIFAAIAFLTLYPNKNEPAPTLFANVPKQQLHLMLDVAIPLVLISSIWGLVGSAFLRVKYFRAVAKREIKSRRDAIIQPDSDCQFVSIIPRENWNRAMFKEQKDCGLLTVDAVWREIRFEGDNERYRIPVDGLLSCTVEKSVLISTAKPNAPGYFMVVLRAQTDTGVFEAPIAPSAFTGIFNSKSRRRAAEALQAKILALNPAMLKKGVEALKR